MEMDLGNGFNFNVGGGITPSQLYTCAAVIGVIVLVVGILNLVKLETMRKEMRFESSKLHEKIDSITKTLKDVE